MDGLDNSFEPVHPPVHVRQHMDTNARYLAAEGLRTYLNEKLSSSSTALTTSTASDFGTEGFEPLLEYSTETDYRGAASEETLPIFAPPTTRTVHKYASLRDDFGTAPPVNYHKEQADERLGYHDHHHHQNGRRRLQNKGSYQGTI